MKLSAFCDGSERFSLTSPVSNVIVHSVLEVKELSWSGPRAHVPVLHVFHQFSLFLYLLLYLSSSWLWAHVYVCGGGGVHALQLVLLYPECMARCQTKADNILKETLQHCIPNWNDLNVYSNQHHNRWRGMNLWQFLLFMLLWFFDAFWQQVRRNWLGWAFDTWRSFCQQHWKGLKILCRHTERHTLILWSIIWK